MRRKRKALAMHYLHTMIRVGDLVRALDFFCGKLGLEEVRRTVNEKGRYTLVYLAAPGDLPCAKEMHAPLIELTHNWDETEYAGGRNFGHLAFAVDDIYAACAKLAAEGVTINRPPRDGHMAFIRSPDNISVELLQKGQPLAQAEPWASAPNIGEW
jgi:lactoylglutathione lyase